MLLHNGFWGGHRIRRNLGGAGGRIKPPFVFAVHLDLAKHSCSSHEMRALLGTITQSGRPLRRGDMRGNGKSGSIVAAACGEEAYSPTRSARVLIATGFRGDRATDAIEAPLAAALADHGVEVHVLRCDEALPACHNAGASNLKSLAAFDCAPVREMCHACCGGIERTFGACGATVHRLSHYLTATDLADALQAAAGTTYEEIPSIHRDGVPIGEYALAAAVHFFGRPSLGHATLDDEPEGEAVLRRFLSAALLLATAAQRFLRREHFDVVVAQHGFDLPQGLLHQICRRNGLRSVNWWTKFRADCVIFGSTGFHTMLATESSRAWDETPWTGEMERRLLRYLDSRWSRGGEPGVPRDASVGARAHQRTVRVDGFRRSIGLIPNLKWDIASDDPGIVYPTVREWVFDTIDFVSKRPDLQLIIRLHPHQPLIGRLAAALIATTYPALADNITVIPGESPVNTYSLMEQCDTVTVWGSTTGLELAARGVPVIVAGPAWVRGKGFTMDPRTKQEYFELLGGPPLRLRPDSSTIERARRCAYHFFFRHMLPMDLFERWSAAQEEGTLESLLADCRQRGHQSLEVICDGILYGKPFLYPDYGPGDRAQDGLFS